MIRSLLVLLCMALPQVAAAVDVRLCTNLGIVEITLDERATPLHARDFARNVDDGFYNGTIIHRVVPGSMIQGGSYLPDLTRRLPRDPIPGEARPGLSNVRGTIAASRAGDSDSASGQFFINLADNTHLDAGPGTAGYTVFGRVTAGLEILDAIAQAPTRTTGSMVDVPLAPVELTSVTTLTREAVFGLSVEPDPAELEQQFDIALGRGDPTAILAAVDALRRSCQTLNTRQYLAETEAAIDLDRSDRARYSLEQYLQGAARGDPLLPRMQRLYAGLPEPGERGGNIEQRVAQCRRPVAPSIPPSGSADLQSLQTIERGLRSYRQNGEFYLRCVGSVIDSGDLNDAEIAGLTALYNDAVIEITAVTTRFNATARAFKEAND